MFFDKKIERPYNKGITQKEVEGGKQDDEVC